MPGRPVAPLAQLHAPHLHQHRRQGPRHRLRHPADGRDAEVEPVLPGQPGLRVPADGAASSGASWLHDLEIENIVDGQAHLGRDEAAAHRAVAQGRQAGAQGLRAVPRPDRAAVPVDARRRTPPRTSSATSGPSRSSSAVTSRPASRPSPRRRPRTRSRGRWYLRQMLGSANITGGKLFHIMSGNLSHQIEHHLFPDLPGPPLPRRSRPRCRRSARSTACRTTPAGSPSSSARSTARSSALALPFGGKPTPRTGRAHHRRCRVRRGLIGIAHGHRTVRDREGHRAGADGVGGHPCRSDRDDRQLRDPRRSRTRSASWAGDVFEMRDAADGGDGR